MLKQPITDAQDRTLDTFAQIVERRHSDLRGVLLPDLSDGVRWGRIIGVHEARRVNGVPQERELRVGTFFHDCSDIELDECLSGERKIVAKHTKDQAIRHDRPEMIRGPVEIVLHQ
jgi:hypothetical protein